MVGSRRSDEGQNNSGFYGRPSTGVGDHSWSTICKRNWHRHFVVLKHGDLPAESGNLGWFLVTFGMRTGLWGGYLRVETLTSRCV